jgi:hypothetical protein
MGGSHTKALCHDVSIILKSFCVGWVIECFACILASTCGSVAIDQKEKQTISKLKVLKFGATNMQCVITVKKKIVTDFSRLKHPGFTYFMGGVNLKSAPIWNTPTPSRCVTVQYAHSHSMCHCSIFDAKFFSECYDDIITPLRSVAAIRTACVSIKKHFLTC